MSEGLIQNKEQIPHMVIERLAMPEDRDFAFQIHREHIVKL